MALDRALGSLGGDTKSVVVVNFPDGREFVWLSADSPIVTSQVGQLVVIRNRRWRVLRREETTNSLTLTLGLA